MRASTLAFATLPLLLGACGGSASETPFPLEPDRATLRAAAASERGTTALPGAGEDDAPPIDEADELPAPDTWGGSKPKGARGTRELR